MSKFKSLLFIVVLIVTSMTTLSFADTKSTQGKVLFINLSKTDLDDIKSIPSLSKELSNRGYIGLMNIKGDGGTDERRSFASMGAGRRATVASENDINFEKSTKDNLRIYKSLTGHNGKNINNLTIDKLIRESKENGKYGAVLGSMGQTLSNNNLKVSVLGNSDTVSNGELIKHRNIGLLGMDNIGRIDLGNIDDINIKDPSMPFGIKTDYQKLSIETKKYYNESDLVLINLGDTYRLDKYKDNLNEKTLAIMKEKIYTDIDNYLNQVFDTVNENDTVYIVSAFPSDENYKENKKLTPVIKLKKDGIGILTSATTRREGIISNIDLGADILNEFGLTNSSMTGRHLELINKKQNVKFLENEYEKILATTQVRIGIIGGFLSIIALSWLILIIFTFIKINIRSKEKIVYVLKEFIKLGLIIPFSFLLAPMFNFKTPVSITLSIIIITLIVYITGRLLFRSDLKQIGFFTLITVLLIVVDSSIGTHLMKNNIMSYDPIVGERYYGVGNEYEGITVAAPIFIMSVMLHYKKINKWFSIIPFIIILVTSAYPSMGANVGGTISETVAYLLFMLFIFDVKIDAKKILLLVLTVIGVISIFAGLDIITKSESHLSLFIIEIQRSGINAIVDTFARKIEMNLGVAKSNPAVVILIGGIMYLGFILIKPIKSLADIKSKYNYVFKGFVSIFIGSMVALVANDTGVVAIATASLYTIIPFTIMIINEIIYKGSKE